MPGVRSRRTAPDIWPGFVDAISALLIIVIFLLMVFTLSQYFLGEILSGRNEALQRLNRQIAELGEMLSLERSSNAELRRDLSQMSAELQSSVAAREDMAATISSLTGERDALEAARERLTARVDELLAEREEIQKSAEADREKITSQLAMMESLRRDIEALRKVRAELEARVGTLDESLTAARDRTKELEARLSTQEERTALAQKEIEKREVRLSELGSALSAEKKLSAEAQNQVALLNRQLDAVRRELARLNAALEASEAKAKEQRVQIANLGQRLNAALASKVEELARYRSEFFGRLREVLGSRQDIRIVGDRFVFQSEVLFETASADLQPRGQTQIRQLADTLKKIAAKIPKDIDWVLRVDGHTDRRPISTPQFPSNWELSTARAIEVVKYLIQLGIPAERLVAAGFGEYQPIDTGNDEIAYRRNRRIEFKLTER